MTPYKIMLMAVFIVIGSCRIANADDSGYFWTLHEPDKPSCPGITVVVSRNGNNLSGTASNSHPNAVSRLSGTIDRQNKFEITLRPTVEGAPAGTIRGSVDSNKGLITATLTGSGCTDGTASFQAGDRP